MNILITGISGILGRAIASAAFKSGYGVVGVSRHITSDSFDFDVKIIQKDLEQEHLSDKDLKNIEVIIHSAADTTMGSFSNRNQNRLNIESLGHLMETALVTGVKRFILVSTANTIRPGSSFKPGTELIKLRANSSRLNYVNSKIEAEELLLNMVRCRGLNALVVNPTFLLNPDYQLSSSNQLIEYALKKTILFYPMGTKNIVDARDAANAIINAISKGRIGHNYLLSNENISYKELNKSVKQKQAKTGIHVPIPSILLVIIAAVLTLLEALLRIPINLNLKSASFLNSDLHYSSQKAKKELDFHPRSVETIIDDFICR